MSATKAPGNDKPVDVLRLGTQELVRRGLRARDMNQVADVMTRITVDHENPEVAGSTVEAIRASVARDAVAS